MNENKLIKEGNGIVYHYTSLETFLKILDGIENDNFIFHATDIFSMNDPTEFIHGFMHLWSILPQIESDLYKKIKNNPQTYNIDLSYLDKRYCLSNMWSNLNGKNKSWLKAYIESMHQSYKTPFVISFSCNYDNLPMWSTYGDHGKGLALGLEIQFYYIRKELDDGTVWYDFSRNVDSELHSILVSYDRISINHPLALVANFYISNYLKSIPSPEINNEDLLVLQVNALDNITKSASAMIKNEAYKYEEESRLISYAQNINDVKFKISSTKKILPYIEIYIPTSRLKKIVIGPCTDYKAVRNAIKIRLKQLNVTLKDDDIVKSKIPFRIL